MVALVGRGLYTSVGNLVIEIICNLLMCITAERDRSIQRGIWLDDLDREERELCRLEALEIEEQLERAPRPHWERA